MLRVDKETTARAGFRDPRSYVGFRIHPDTEHACVYLFGEDVGERRAEIRARHNARCVFCGAYCWVFGELHHVDGGLGPQRCWCYENLTWACGECHRVQHGRMIGGRKST
jgi:5-methylcytosine-specific restriction endonuclease McrA